MESMPWTQKTMAGNDENDDNADDDDDDNDTADANDDDNDNDDDDARGMDALTQLRNAAGPPVLWHRRNWMQFIRRVDEYASDEEGGYCAADFEF